MANINIPFNCDYESINITVKCPIEGTDREEQTIIAQLKKERDDWVFCTPGSIVSKNIKILNNEGSYEIIDNNGNFKGKIVGDVLSSDGKVILNVEENKIETDKLVVSSDTVLNNVTINGKLTIRDGADIIKVGSVSKESSENLGLINSLEKRLEIVEKRQPQAPKNTTQTLSKEMLEEFNSMKKTIVLLTDQVKSLKSKVDQYENNIPARSVLEFANDEKLEGLPTEKVEKLLNNLSDRLVRREQFLPIITDETDLSEKNNIMGKSIPYLIVKGSGKDRTIKLINKYTDNNELIYHYYYQLNNATPTSSEIPPTFQNQLTDLNNRLSAREKELPITKINDINRSNVVSLVDRYRNYLPIVDDNNLAPLKNSSKPFILVNNKGERNEKVQLVNFQDNKTHYYQLK